MSAGEGPAQRRDSEISLATRRRLFFVSGAVLAALMTWALAGMPGFGDYPASTGCCSTASRCPRSTRPTSITAVNFDYRGFDTLGEEFILFAAVLGLALHPPRAPRRGGGAARRRRRRPAGDRCLGGGAADHGGPGRARPYCWPATSSPTARITPGGGFQGGVIAATALLFVYLGGEYVALRHIRPLPLVEITKATGAAGFVLIGIAGLIWGVAFLDNWLPKGTPGDVFSAGTMQLLSVAVGFEITGGFVLILSEFLDQTIVLRRRRGARSA